MEEEWEIGWVVRNNRSGALHTVTDVQFGFYTLIPEGMTSGHWQLIRNRTMLATYEVVSRDGTSPAGPSFIKFHPPVPAKREVIEGPLWEGSIYWIRPSSKMEGFPIEMYVPDTPFLMFLNEETLGNLMKSFSVLLGAIKEMKN